MKVIYIKFLISLFFFQWNKEILVDKNKILGKGGFGSVFLGTLGIKRLPVAVKRIELMKMDETSSKREEEALGNLDHLNVIKLFHAEDDEDFR